jgi:hypothetical protein
MSKTGENSMTLDTHKKRAKLDGDAVMADGSVQNAASAPHEAPEVVHNRPVDEIDAVLETFGSKASYLNRLAQVSVNMQSIEWRLARRQAEATVADNGLRRRSTD